MVEFPIVLNPDSDSPLYQQLYQALREAIFSGDLKAGEPLPSTRDLSRKLGVSRDTVLRAIELLMGHGYLETHQRSLTTVCCAPRQENDEADEAPPAALLPPPPISRFAQSVISEENVSLAKELNYGAAAYEELPAGEWRRLLHKHLRNGSQASPTVVEPLGYMPLRQSIASYLNRFRSLRCHAANVVIFAGPMSALDFIARLVLNVGDRVAVENPGFRHARRLFSAHGAKLVPVDVDPEGMVVEQLIGADSEVRLVYITPAHHDPTGAVLPMSRRTALLQWAGNTGGTIIEDGYDSEYWYKNRPLPALQGLDLSQSVIYVSSFWRALFPFSRVSFAIFPDRWLPAASALKGMLEREVPIVEQKAIRDFILEGYLERYLRRSHRLFAHRRQLLLLCLGRHLGGKIWMAKESAGMHLLIQLRLALSEEAILEAANSADLPIISTRHYYVRNPLERQFLVPFAHLTDERIIGATQKFAESILHSAQALEAK